MENPYNMVKENKWTYDAFAALIKDGKASYRNG